MVPLKPGNHHPWDSVEGRGDRIAEPENGTMSETLSSGNVTTKFNG